MEEKKLKTHRCYTDMEIVVVFSCVIENIEIIYGNQRGNTTKKIQRSEYTQQIKSAKKS